jgi:hypothetical protein
LTKSLLSLLGVISMKTALDTQHAANDCVLTHVLKIIHAPELQFVRLCHMPQFALVQMDM